MPFLSSEDEENKGSFLLSLYFNSNFNRFPFRVGFLYCDFQDLNSRIKQHRWQIDTSNREIEHLNRWEIFLLSVLF